MNLLDGRLHRAPVARQNALHLKGLKHPIEPIIQIGGTLQGHHKAFRDNFLTSRRAFATRFGVIGARHGECQPEVVTIHRCKLDTVNERLRDGGVILEREGVIECLFVHLTTP